MSTSRNKRKRRSNITDDDIFEYISKKAMKAAKKLKAHDRLDDSNLNEIFVWRKKIERDITQGLPLDMFSLEAERKQRERLAEIEKVKKRREERAIVKAQHEEEMASLARERAGAEYQDLKKKEEEFLFNQSKIQSEIRWQEGRAKPIDILFRQLDLPEKFDIKMSEFSSLVLIVPYSVFQGLTVKEMEELCEGIEMHKNRATPAHEKYWESLSIIGEWELAKSRKKNALDRARVCKENPPLELVSERKGLHPSIEADVKKFLGGKSYSDLELLRSCISESMVSDNKVVEFWEAVHSMHPIFKAKAYLKECHSKMLGKYLERLEQLLMGEDDEALNQKLFTLRRYLEQLEQPSEGEDDEALDQTLSIRKEVENYEDNATCSHGNLYGEDFEVIDQKHNKVIPERKRKAVRIEGAMTSRPPVTDEDLELKARKQMGVMEEGDAVLSSNDEISFDYQWQNNYHLKKPKYFNRVHSGYEWNKYNRTHYDHDNPPPKTVQGYKFNMFYPDLVDKNKAPLYTRERDGDCSDTCIIKFVAGPPYQDIAFRIVNNEWEKSHKKGFKSTFEGGILRLYFNFKRHKYRR